jgi:hypothetical protein
MCYRRTFSETVVGLRLVHVDAKGLSHRTQSARLRERLPSLVDRSEAASTPVPIRSVRESARIFCPCARVVAMSDDPGTKYPQDTWMGTKYSDRSLLKGMI